MRRTVILSCILVAICSLLLPRQTLAQGDDVRTTVDALREATLAGDLDGLVALYSPDAAVVSPFGTFTGQEAIRGFYTGYFAQNPGLAVKFVDRQTTFFTEVHRSLVSSDFIRSLGLERVVFIETIVAPQGRVLAVTILLDLSDPQTAQLAAALG